MASHLDNSRKYFSAYLGKTIFRPGDTGLEGCHRTENRNYVQNIHSVSLTKPTAIFSVLRDDNLGSSKGFKAKFPKDHRVYQKMEIVFSIASAFTEKH